MSKHVAAKAPGERFFLDLSSVKGTKDGPKVARKENCRLMVDERTRVAFSEFFATKKGILESTPELLHKMISKCINVKYIRMDNAGRNKKLQARSESKDWILSLEFEYTARNTTQQNSPDEVKFATIASRGRAMMYRGNMPAPIRYQVLPKVFETAILMGWLVVIEMDGVKKTRYEHFLGRLPKFVNNMRTVGETDTVTTKSNMTPKLYDKGVTCIFISYSRDHHGDCYEMVDPLTSTVYHTRDVT